MTSVYQPKVFMLELQNYVKSDSGTSQSHLKAFNLRKYHSNTFRIQK